MQSRLILGALVGVLVTAGAALAQEATQPNTEGYVWAGECKACHEAIYDAWAKTKHARAIERLNGDQRQAGSECIGCHVTGPKQPVMADGTMVNANIQCEGCHGPGKAHVEAAKSGNPKGGGIITSPQASGCETCHNQKSPHYRGFFFAALKGLVHRP